MRPFDLPYQPRRASPWGRVGLAMYPSEDNRARRSHTGRKRREAIIGSRAPRAPVADRGKGRRIRRSRRRSVA
jgi:hypothetical protein